MNEDVKRIRELMGLKILNEGIEPWVVREFRDFFESLISHNKMTKQEAANAFGKNARQEIRTLSNGEIEKIIKDLDYESVARILFNRGIHSPIARQQYFDNFISRIQSTTSTMNPEQALDMVLKDKTISTTYNISLGKPRSTDVPEYIKKLETEYNKVFAEDFKSELEKRHIQIPKPNVDILSVDEMKKMMQDRNRVYDYVEKEVSSLKSKVGRKIPRAEIAKFTDELFKLVNETFKQFEPQFEILFKDFDVKFAQLDDKTKAEFLQRAFNEFKTKVSADTNLNKTISKWVVDGLTDYFKSYAGIKEIIAEFKAGKKLWTEILLPRYKYTLGLSMVGTIGEILRGKNPIEDWGGILDWGRAKYFLTLIPGLNTTWSTLYAIYQFSLLGVETVYKKIRKDYEGEGGAYSKSISIDEAKNFVLNENGLSGLLPDGIDLTQLEYKGKEKGRAIDILFDGGVIATLIKDCKSLDRERLKEFGACQIKIR